MRLEDHSGLATAARYGPVIPALVVDPDIAARLARNVRRANYYCGAVASLDASLGARGSRLICRRGALVATTLALARECGAGSVVLSIAYDAASLARQRTLQAELEEAGLRATLVHDAPAVAPEETAAARSDGGLGYRSFGAYFAAWATLPRAPLDEPVTFAPVPSGREPLRSEPLPTPGEFGHGGVAPSPAPSEAGALAALDAYLASSVLSYAAAATTPTGEVTAHLSAPLGIGTVSARTVLARVDARARDPFLLAEERLGLRAFTRALARRDFFLQLAWFFEDAPDAPLQRRMRSFPFTASHPALDAWKSGTTGYPLVDAGVRQLHETGWMHPRVRLVAASFLCFDLGVDWRVGRDAWEDELEEDDPALATGNWQWVAGVGADLAQFPRIYNPRKAARAFDPAGAYVRRYVAELANVPEQRFLAARSEHVQLPLALYDDVYPSPVVDHDREARAFLKRYARFAASV